MTPKSLSLATLSADDLTALVTFTSLGATAEPWATFLETPLPSEARGDLAFVLRHVRPFAITLNESTLWARAIFPMLMLAETDRVVAWSQVPVSATDPVTGATLTGVLDGVLAPEGPLGGAAGMPFLLTVEAKRGTDATDPRPQLLGGLLASAWALRARGEAPRDDLYGCFTVGTVWTFVRVSLTATTQPPGWSMTLAWSREFAEGPQGESILQVLRGIVRAQDTA